MPNVEQSVVFTEDAAAALNHALRTLEPDRVFVLADVTTQNLCLPRLRQGGVLPAADPIVIGATDAHKNLESLTHVWTALQQGGASRRSCLVCLGGGMVTDLGGFAAATFKRGIRCVNLPTTLLSMVDAAVGGKTGINFGGLKNEIGVFRQPEAVIIDTGFLRTLDDENLRSGYAEMLKHGLIASEAAWAELLRFDLDHVDFGQLQRLVEKSIGVKERIVDQDPTERGLRKALNLGHTAGHALESLALAGQHPVLHGYAVAWGLACELYLSVVKAGFPQDMMRQTVQFVQRYYGTMGIQCNEYDRLLDYMKHDKKNVGGVINFTLLRAPGDILLDQTATQEEIFEMFDFFRESLG